MTEWHGYILYEKHPTLTNQEWDNAILAMEGTLNDFPDDPQPAKRLHHRFSLDGEKVIYEALFIEAKMNHGVLTAALVAWIKENIDPNASVGTYVKNKLTVWELGEKWNKSGDEARQYLFDNQSEWEPANP